SIERYSLREWRNSFRTLPLRSGNRLTLGIHQFAVWPKCDSSLCKPLTDEELERRPCSAARFEHSIHLPLGEHVHVRLACGCPIAELWQPANSNCKEDALVDGALEALLTNRNIKASFLEFVVE